MTDQPVTYQGSGVNYDVLDRFKIAAQHAANNTNNNMSQFGITAVLASRGESVFLTEQADCYTGDVIEGLGTKNLLIDAYLDQAWLASDDRRYEYYRFLAQDTVAMIINDMITLGVRPRVLKMYLGVGHADWFNDEARWSGLLDGWAAACSEVPCIWGPGETPILKGIINPLAADISGSANGEIYPKNRRIMGDIADGDAIVMLASSGVHANGLTLARSILDKVGYDARMPNGQPFVDALLQPTTLYASVIEVLISAGLKPHYAINITGHGWRKLLRPVEPFVYTIDSVPEPQPVFDYIAAHGPVTREEMYGNYNMGAGFALYVPAADAIRVVDVAENCGTHAWIAGHVSRQGLAKRVDIDPLNITFDGEALAVRA